MTQAVGLGGVDLAVLAVVSASALVGLWRGLVLELMSLVGWVVAWFLATLLAPSVGGQLFGDQAAALGGGREGLAFALCFIGVMIAWNLLARLLSLIVQATPLNWPDRGLGALFGLLRGVVLVVVVVLVVNSTRWAQSVGWKESVAVHWVSLSFAAVAPWLPPAWEHWLRSAGQAVSSGFDEGTKVCVASSA
jgi:membrane protein required for colicin V production